MAEEPHMNESQRVTAEDLERTAELANLELSGDESSRMLRDMNAILDHIAQLNELDTSTVLPMSQVAELLGSEGRDQTALRADTVAPSLDRMQVMACAPDSDRTYFRVPKVIER